jgi:hypothetical protein
MLTLQIAISVLIGNFLYEWLDSKLRAAQKDEDNAVKVWQRQLSSDARALVGLHHAPQSLKRVEFSAQTQSRIHRTDGMLARIETE